MSTDDNRIYIYGDLSEAYGDPNSILRKGVLNYLNTATNPTGSECYKKTGFSKSQIKHVLNQLVADGSIFFNPDGDNWSSYRYDYELPYPDWYNRFWRKRYPLKVNAGKVVGTLNNFERLTDITSDDLKNRDPDSFIVASPDGTKHKVEVDYYQPFTGRLILWDLVPQISDGYESHLYFDRETLTQDEQNSEELWAANSHEMVFHLGDFINSVNGENADNRGTITATAPTIIGWTQFYNGIDTRVLIPNPHITTNSIKVSAWVNINSVGTNNRGVIVGQSANAEHQHPFYNWLLYRFGNGKFQFRAGGATIDSNLAYGNGRHMITGVYDGESMRLYVDDKLAGIRLKSGNVVDSPTFNPTIGGRNTTNLAEFLNAQIDEVRVATDVTNMAHPYVRAQYVNQNDPVGFQTIGDIESLA